MKGAFGSTSKALVVSIKFDMSANQNAENKG